MKRVGALFLAVVMMATLLFTGVIPAAAETANGYTYTVSNNEATITDYTGSASGTLVIPATLGGYPVTTIGIDAFVSTNWVDTIIIPEGVKTIKQEAFQYVFHLATISIPSTVTTIERNAFVDCERLTNITVEAGNTVYASQDGVLFNKAKTTLLEYPGGKTDAPYTIPSTVTRIEQEAFKNCKNLTDVNIPTSVTAISYDAFAGSGIYKDKNSWTNGALIIDGCLVAMDDEFITEYYAPNLTTFTVPNGVRLIASGVFSPCYSLKTLGLPETLKYICDDAIDQASITKINFAGSKSQWNTVVWNETNWSIDWAIRSGNFSFAKADPVKNGWVEDGDKKQYFVNGVALVNEWEYIGGKWYFFDANGYMLTNKWQKDSKGWVYVGADGAMLTNAWCKDSKGWCYVGADGYAVTNTWKKDSHGWIYLDANGSMTKSKWVKTSGKWYYCDANGYMLTNKWQKDSKGWVYIGADGAMVTNKWVKDSKGWCYVGADGYAVTNCWKKDSKGWIYLDANGSMTKSKWVKDGGKWYYCDANGYMVANKSMKIGNKTYNFNASGVCTNP